MKRIAVALFAFVLGLCGSIVVMHVVDVADAVDNGALLGRLDVEKHCRSLYGDRAIALLTRPAVDGWQCASRSNGIFDTATVNFDEACQMQYDAVSHALATDPNWPLSWECFEGPRP